MAEASQFNMDNPIHKYCVSWFTINVSNSGLKLFVSSWNAHPMPGEIFFLQVKLALIIANLFTGRRSGLSRGIPNERILVDNRTRRIDRSLLPSANEITQQYRNSGGQITDIRPVGVDPIADNSHKCSIRMSSFTEYYPSFDLIFHQGVNGNDSLFQDALKFFIDITYRLSSS